jgi:hypothetical protein
MRTHLCTMTHVCTSGYCNTWCGHICVLWHMFAHLGTVTRDADTYVYYDTYQHFWVLWHVVLRHLGTDTWCRHFWVVDTCLHIWVLWHVMRTHLWTMTHVGTSGHWHVIACMGIATRDVGTSGCCDTSYCHDNHHAEARSLQSIRKSKLSYRGECVSLFLAGTQPLSVAISLSM